MTSPRGRKLAPRLAAGLAALGAALAAVGAAAPSDTLIRARQQIHDPAINAVTFRTMDAWFPIEEVRHGRASRLPLRLAPVAPRVPIGGSEAGFDEALQRTYTNALLVIRDGAIIDERYFNGSQADDRFLSWSMAKSITSILLGIALDRRLIRSIADPVEVYLPELRGTAFEGATLEQLLLMRDGTSYTEQKQDGQSTLDVIHERALIRNETRFTDVTGLGLTLETPHGGRFRYSTLTSGILGRVVEAATGRTLAQFTEEALWKPAGMEAPAYWVLDGELPEGRALGGAAFNATLRDYGRIGLMMLNGGRANGRQIVSRKWVEASTRYTGSAPVIPQAPRGYQYQWWTILGTERFEAIGIHGQFMSIDPVTRTVIVKLSYWPELGGRQYNLDTLALFDAIRAAL